MLSYQVPFYHLSTLDVTHVRKDIRPSSFFRATESGVQAWEQGYTFSLLTLFNYQGEITPICATVLQLKYCSSSLHTCTLRKGWSHYAGQKGKKVRVVNGQRQKYSTVNIQIPENQRSQTFKPLNRTGQSSCPQRHMQLESLWQ